MRPPSWSSDNNHLNLVVLGIESMAKQLEIAIKVRHLSVIVYMGVGVFPKRVVAKPCLSLNSPCAVTTSLSTSTRSSPSTTEPSAETFPCRKMHSEHKISCHTVSLCFT